VTNFNVQAGSWSGVVGSADWKLRYGYDRSAAFAFSFLETYCAERGRQLKAFMTPQEADLSEELKRQVMWKDHIAEGAKSNAIFGFWGAICAISSLLWVLFTTYSLRDNPFWWNDTSNWIAPIMLGVIFGFLSFTFLSMHVVSLMEVKHAKCNWHPEVEGFERVAMSGWLITDTSLIVIFGGGPAKSLQPCAQELLFQDIGTVRLKQRGDRWVLSVSHRDGGSFFSKYVPEAEYSRALEFQKQLQANLTAVA
jgi:hypothetical protein